MSAILHAGDRVHLCIGAALVNGVIDEKATARLAEDTIARYRDQGVTTAFYTVAAGFAGITVVAIFHDHAATDHIG